MNGIKDKRGRGRPRVRGPIARWLAEHPEVSEADLARALGVSLRWIATADRPFEAARRSDSRAMIFFRIIADAGAQGPGIAARFIFAREVVENSCTPGEGGS